MTLLIVVAVVLLSVRIAAVLVWLVHQHENRVPFDPEERKTRFERQIMTLRVPARNYLTKDNVSVRVDAVVHLRVVNPVEARTNEQNNHSAVSEMVQASLRSVIGKVERDDLMSNRGQLAAETPSLMKPTQRGLQDAPRFGPHDAAGNPQDAVRGPHGAAQADSTIAQVDGLDTPSQRQPVPPDVKAVPPSAIGAAKRLGPTKAVRESANGRRMSFVRQGRSDRSRGLTGSLRRDREATVEKSILDSLPRPVGGPSCLGGRGDAGYLRGWDDAVDWIGQGNPANPPTWGDVAYMTGWNDATRAIAKARLGEKTCPAAQAVSST